MASLSISYVAETAKFYGYSIRVIYIGRNSACLYACHPNALGRERGLPAKLESNIGSRSYVESLYRFVVRS